MLRVKKKIPEYNNKIMNEWRNKMKRILERRLPAKYLH